VAIEAAILYETGRMTNAGSVTHDSGVRSARRWRRPARLAATVSLMSTLSPLSASAQSSGRTHPHLGKQAAQPAAVSHTSGRAITAESCVWADEHALARLDAHDWLTARDDFEQCAVASCPNVVRDECATQLRRLLPRIPRVVFAARNPDGQDLVDVRVYANGSLLLSQLGAEGLSMNPGRYRFALVGPDGRKTERDVLLREGEVNRRVDVVFVPPAAPGMAPESPPPAPQTIWTLPVTISAVIAATGLALFGFFAITGKSIESCRPACTRSEVDQLRRDYLVADVSLGVAVVSAATGAYFVWDRRASAGPITARLSHRHGGGFLSAELGF
jgi:hypothetical protein